MKTNKPPRPQHEQQRFMTKDQFVVYKQQALAHKAIWQFEIKQDIDTDISIQYKVIYLFNIT